MLGGFGTDAGQPEIFQRMQKRDFLSARDHRERGRLVEFRGDLADELVGADAFADGDFQGLADGAADDVCAISTADFLAPVRSK